MEQATEEWTEIILPKGKFFDLGLKDVWRYRDLMLLFVKRDMAAQYRQTILGPLWHVIQPVFTTVMLLVVFNKIANISTDGLPPILFYMSGITIWNYFATCLTATSSTFTSNSGIFGKVYFPRLVLPLSTVLSNMAKFAIQFCLVIALMLYYTIQGNNIFTMGWHYLLIPIIVIIMALLGLGIGIVISSLTTKYRDLTILIGFGVNLLMYITPVPYPLSYLASKGYASFVIWNPLSPLIEGFRYALFGTGTFSIFYFTYSIACSLIILMFGMLMFNRVERSFMDTV